MSSTLERDQETARNRKETLQDVEVPLREVVLSKLVKKLEDMDEGVRTQDIWETGNMRRAERLNRQEKLLQEYDEFLEPIIEPAHEWSSTLHLPITYTICRTVHARMLSALLDIDPPFSMKAREASRVDQKDTVEQLMRYTLKEWLNNYQGADQELDEWVWNWVVSGSGVIKARWDREYEKYLDIVIRPRLQEVSIADPQTGEERIEVRQRPEEVEEEVLRKVFDGPKWEAVNEEDVLVIGGKGDPQNADNVLHSVYMTAGQLWSLADQRVFKKESVKAAIEWGESSLSAEINAGIKHERMENAGVTDLDNDLDSPRYQILERYAKIDVFGSGVPTEIVMWVHKDTGKILRATYLRRMMPSGLRPFFKIDFHKRYGQETGVGLAEILYTLQREMDAIHNMKVDFGLISSMPFGYYRATSNLAEERIPLEPGTLIPVNDPQSDVVFPNIGAKWSFTAQEEQFLLSQIERVTSISDLSLGIIAGQGATRTATGTRALVGESNANLNVFLRRLNRGWKQLLNYTFQMLQMNLEPGFQFRITGDDGQDYFQEIQRPEEIAGKWDFELDSNSANSNKAVQLQVANQIYQLTANPIDLQLGLITPLERYEALKNLFKANGVKDFGRYLRKPDGINRLFSPLEIMNRVLAGIDFPFTPDQDLGGFIALVNEVLSDDALLGQFDSEQVLLLVEKQRQAQQLLQALQAQQAQVNNQQQIQTNAGLAQDGPSGAAPAQAPPPAANQGS